MNKDVKREIGEKRMSFSVPEGFFDSLPDATVARMRRRGLFGKSDTPFVLKRVAAAAIPLAACLAVGLLIFDKPSPALSHKEEICEGNTFDCFLKSLTDEELSDLAFQVSIDPVDINM